MPLAVLRNGQWFSTEIVGYGRDGELLDARILNISENEMVHFTTTGSSFHPSIELVVGSTAQVTWLVNGVAYRTGTQPDIDFGSVGVRDVSMLVTKGLYPAYEDVVTVNLGFNTNEDAGRFNIGASYNHSNQLVSAVENLTLLTGLRRFCCAHCPIAGSLDFSGLSHLEFIECFMADVSEVVLDGCISLMRLCLENTRCTEINLNPVRHCLYDLRSAVQRRLGGLVFTALEGPMEKLYHYCIRDQTVTQIIPNSLLPVIEDHWAWNTQQTTAEPFVSPFIHSFISYQNDYSQAAVNALLTSVDSLMNTPGTFFIDGGTSAAPSGAAVTAAASLRAKNWTVTTN